MKSVRLLCKHLGKLIFRPIFSNQKMLLSNLKPVATLQYKPEGPHVLFYMTGTTKANQMREQEHTHARQA